MISDLLFSFGMGGRIRILRDEQYLKIMYWCHNHKHLNLVHPVSYTEKLQWLKLNVRDPQYTSLVDKLEAKNYISNIVGSTYVIPTLGVYDDFDDIDFRKLPNKFVLKCTHDSGGIAICRNKKTFDYSGAKKKLNKSLHRNYYWVGREWPYRYVKPRIIAEPLLEGPGSDHLLDYKFFCFHGDPKIMYIGADKAEEPFTDFFDMDFHHLPIRMRDPNAKQVPKKPDSFEEMIELAKKLSKDFIHVRVDFYYVNGKTYVGELTFYHNSGFSRVSPEEWELKLGEWI